MVAQGQLLMVVTHADRYILKQFFDYRYLVDVTST